MWPDFTLSVELYNKFDSHSIYFIFALSVQVQILSIYSICVYIDTSKKYFKNNMLCQEILQKLCT